MKKVILAFALFAMIQHGFSQVIQIDPETDKKTTTETDKKSDVKEKPEKKEKKSSGEDEYYKEGFTGITEFGTVLGFGGGFGGVLPGFSFNQVLGKRASQKFGAGVGIGVEYIKFGGLNLPVTVDMRVYFLKGRVSPILYIAPGYQFTSSTAGFTGGLHAVVFNLGPGVEFKINKKVGISAVTGYKFTDVLPQAGNGKINSYGHGWFFRVGIVY